jgi:glycosyltransferase involved in cell wall biosynthesis
MSRPAVLFVAHTQALGLLFHFTKFIPHLMRECDPDMDFYAASIAKEQEPGLWDALRASVPSSRLLVLPDNGSITGEATKLLETRDKVIVHCQGYRQVREMSPLKKRYGSHLDLIITMHAFRHGTLMQLPVSLLSARRYSRDVSRVVFLSPFAMRQFAGAGKLARQGKIVMIPLGVEEQSAQDLQATPPQLGDPDIGACLRDPALACLVYLARFTDVKGHGWLIEGMAPVLRMHPEARLLLPGDGPLRQDMITLARSLGLSSQVLIPGRIDRKWVPWILTRARVGLAISSSETFGHNSVEPMALGCPVIATRVGVAEWTINDFVTGFGVAWQDRIALGRYANLLLSDRELASAIGQRGQALARMMFSWPKVAAANVRMYRSLVEPTASKQD